MVTSQQRGLHYAAKRTLFAAVPLYLTKQEYDRTRNRPIPVQFDSLLRKQLAPSGLRSLREENKNCRTCICSLNTTSSKRVQTTVVRIGVGVEEVPFDFAEVAELRNSLCERFAFFSYLTHLSSSIIRPENCERNSRIMCTQRRAKPCVSNVKAKTSTIS